MTSSPKSPDAILAPDYGPGMDPNARAKQYGQPGGNAPGMSKEAAHLRVQLREHALKKAEKMIDRLVEIATNSEDDDVARKAAVDVLSYALGKPVPIVDTNPGAPSALAQIAAALLVTPGD